MPKPKRKRYPWFEGDLSPREGQIVEMLASGMSPEEVADELGIAYNTIRTQQENIRRRLGLHSTSAVIVWWWANASRRWHEALLDIEEFGDDESRDIAIEALAGDTGNEQREGGVVQEEGSTTTG